MNNLPNKAKKEGSKQRLVIIILAVIIIALLLVTLWIVLKKDDSSGPIIPDYQPPETESNQNPIEGDDNSKLDAPEGGGAISIEYVNQVVVDLSDGMAYLSYSNPGKSTQNIVLRIEVQETAIVQSGVITPGNEVKALPLADGAAQKLQVGVYTNAVFRILSYDPATGEKAMVDTLAEITVTVQE